MLASIVVAVTLFVTAGGTFHWYRYEGHPDPAAWLIIGADIAVGLLVLGLALWT